MTRVRRFMLIPLLLMASIAWGQKILIPMDLKQTDHLKAYGIAYWALTKNIEVDWLLNYRGGSFMLDGVEAIAQECRVRGVLFEQISGAQASQIYSEVQAENNNMDAVRLEKAPKIAVYVTPNLLPWDDAVTLVMEYAEIPYDKVWDPEVLQDKLLKYDWIHLHHEDFTGQYGKFYANYSSQPWYVEQQVLYEKKAKELGFGKVSEVKKAVVRKIKEDMVATLNQETDYFTLFEFSAKYDPVPTMLTQDHANIIKGFLGQTTNFKKSLIKKNVTILAEKEGTEEVRYIHGNLGRGTWTFYGGHDPEDYQHAVGDPPTDLRLHKNSPGYRLILNNILFPAAKKKQQKT